MNYRQSTGDYWDNGKVYDLYAIRSNKSDASSVKRKLSERYKNVRILKRRDGYHIIYNSWSSRKSSSSRSRSSRSRSSSRR